MYIGLDYETQGFNAETDAPTEIGLVAFNDKFEELSSLNFIIKSPITRPQTQEIIEITGITDAMISTGFPEAEVVEQIYPQLAQARAIFAYNAPFDNAFLKEMLKRQSAPALDTLVVDVMRDIDYPPRMTCKKLSHLAYDHGIMVHKDSLHRATEDVRLMIKLLSRYGVGAAIDNAREPKVTLRIHTKGPWEDKGVSNEYAKKAGFKFEPDKKIWIKEVRESQVSNYANSEYRVERLK